jgi:hypothetical protein
MAKLLQKVSEPLRDAPDIFFRRAERPGKAKRGAKDTGDNLQLLTAMGSRAAGSLRRLLSFQL